MRFGTAALFGRSNVGKSTLLNGLIGEPLAIVSPWPQTTRDALLGVVTKPEFQIAFVDTPGIHRPRTELGRRMNAAAVEAARTTDVVLFVTDVKNAARGEEKTSEHALSDEDRAIIDSLPPRVPAIAVINKVDLIRDKSVLLPMIAAISNMGRFEQCIPLSALTGDGVERLLEAIAMLLPPGPAGYDPEMLTDRPAIFFVREYVREQVLLATRGEVPHAVAVTVDRFDESKHLAVIKATLHVEKASQRPILLGKGGARIKEIGTRARLRLEELLGRRVHLELFVRVSPRWKDAPRQLAELGHEAVAASGSEGHATKSERGE